MKYVAGFLFDSKHERVALIHKNRGPEAIVGHWNSIGGKRKYPLEYENSEWEDPHVAMQREFLEETGVYIPHDRWDLALTLCGVDWEVQFFEATDDVAITQVRTMETEEVRWFRMDKLPDLVPNLRWILPMVIGRAKDHVDAYEVTERVAA